MGNCITIPKIHTSKTKVIPSCTICFESIVSEDKTLVCGHHFHSPCIDRWLTKATTCPMCRTEVTPKVDSVSLRIIWSPVGGGAWRRDINVITAPLLWHPTDGPMPESLVNWLNN